MPPTDGLEIVGHHGNNLQYKKGVFVYIVQLLQVFVGSSGKRVSHSCYLSFFSLVLNTGAIVFTSNAVYVCVWNGRIYLDFSMVACPFPHFLIASEEARIVSAVCIIDL